MSQPPAGNAQRRSALAQPLLLHGQLGGGHRLQALVGDRLAAWHSQPVDPAVQARFGALERRQLDGEILGQSSVELTLVEVLRAHVAGFAGLGVVLVDGGNRLLNPPPLGGQQLTRSLGVHVVESSAHVGRLGYSHSMVPGGLLVMSRTTRFTSRSSLIIRAAIVWSRSYGSLAQSAVIASSLVTARTTTT